MNLVTKSCCLQRDENSAEGILCYSSSSPGSPWQYSPRAHAWLRPEAANIFGALDLEGASTQITFMPEGSEMSRDEASEFTLYGYSYNIYTHSYLCYGQNEMQKRLAKELIMVRGS